MGLWLLSDGLEESCRGANCASPMSMCSPYGDWSRAAGLMVPLALSKMEGIWSMSTKSPWSSQSSLGCESSWSHMPAMSTSPPFIAAADSVELSVLCVVDESEAESWSDAVGEGAEGIWPGVDCRTGWAFGWERSGFDWIRSRKSAEPSRLRSGSSSE